jgi:hypothetical protein
VDAYDDSKSKTRSSGGFKTAFKGNALKSIDEKSFEESEDIDDETFEETKDAQMKVKEDSFFNEESKFPLLDNKERDKTTITPLIKHKTHAEEDNNAILLRFSDGHKPPKFGKDNKTTTKNSYFRTSNNSSSMMDDDNQMIDDEILK